MKRQRTTEKSVCARALTSPKTKCAAAERENAVLFGRNANRIQYASLRESCVRTAVAVAAAAAFVCNVNEWEKHKKNT